MTTSPASPRCSLIELRNLTIVALDGSENILSINGPIKQFQSWTCDTSKNQKAEEKKNSISKCKLFQKFHKKLFFVRWDRYKEQLENLNMNVHKKRKFWDILQLYASPFTKKGQCMDLLTHYSQALGLMTPGDKKHNKNNKALVPKLLGVGYGSLTTKTCPLVIWPSGAAPLPIKKEQEESWWTISSLSYA